MDSHQSDASNLSTGSDPLVLHGWRLSINTRIMRLLLAEKGLRMRQVNADPFAEPAPATLANLHLTSMVAAFVIAPEGAALLPHFPDLARWWQAIATRPSLLATGIGLPPHD